MKIVDGLFLPLNYKPTPKKDFGSIWTDENGMGYKIPVLGPKEWYYELTNPWALPSGNNTFPNGFMYGKTIYSYITYMGQNNEYIVAFGVGGSPSTTLARKNYNVWTLTATPLVIEVIGWILPSALENTFTQYTGFTDVIGDKEYRCILESNDGVVNNDSISKINFTNMSTVNLPNLNTLQLNKDLIISWGKNIKTFGSFKVAYSTPMSYSDITLTGQGIYGTGSASISGLNIDLWEDKKISGGEIQNCTISKSNIIREDKDILSYTITSEGMWYTSTGNWISVGYVKNKIVNINLFNEWTTAFINTTFKGVADKEYIFPFWKSIGASPTSWEYVVAVDSAGNARMYLNGATNAITSNWSGTITIW